jgi:hypothetical protein
MLKASLILITGTIAFYCTSCLAGIIFSGIGFYYTPFVMFLFAVPTEIVFVGILFRTSPKRLWPGLLIGDGIFFFLLFLQMV